MNILILFQFKHEEETNLLLQQLGENSCNLLFI